MERYVTCSFCGNRFDPAAAQTACQACPLQRGCRLVRCPACGFEMVDPQGSTLARLAARLFPPKQAKGQTMKDHVTEGNDKT
jgi:hypothetical protein